MKTADTPPLVFLDTETTGLHPDRRPWEIAIIRRDEDGQSETTIQIRDVDLANAELIGLQIGRFHDRHLNYGDADYDRHESDDQHLFLTEAVAAAEVELLTRGAHIVGAVPNFDTECLAAMLRRHRLCPAWHFHLIDIEALAVGFLHGRAVELERIAQQFSGEPWDSPANDAGLFRSSAQPPWRSDDLSAAIGVDPPSKEERHTAMGDARWAMRLYDAITGGTR